MVITPFEQSLESRNQPKSLSGIETNKQKSENGGVVAGINLNPYQGLKQIVIGGPEINIIAGINLNPYQGLKRPIAKISSQINVSRN